MRGALCIFLAMFTEGACSKSEAPAACVPVLQGWATPETGKPASVIDNLLTLTGREMRWNGVRIDELTLAEYVRRSAAMQPIPVLIFDPGDPPECSFATKIQAEIDQVYPCRDGACWQGSKAAFERANYRIPRNSSAVP